MVGYLTDFFISDCLLEFSHGKKLIEIVKEIIYKKNISSVG